MDKLKVMTILGTRPEIIRLSRVIAALDESVEHVLVHTGQNYDFELNEVFFGDLGLRKPKYFLSCGGSSLGEVLGKILVETEKVLKSEAPDAVLILGDTNSSLAGLMAKRMKIPLYHMEAGNRCFDANVPEEINRKLIDTLADFNLVYTEHARRHLLSEGFPHRRIYLTGSPMREVLEFYGSNIESSEALGTQGVAPQEYLLASFHREENVDNKQNLSIIVHALNKLAQEYRMKVIVSLHPRTRERLGRLEGVVPGREIIFSRPFGFHDYNKLQKNAFCVISDSGTISEEAALLSFPAVTIRNSIERPEALDTGSIMISGLDEETILRSVEIVTEQQKRGLVPPIPPDYLHANVSQRVLRLIVGTSRLSHKWDGVISHDSDSAD